MEIEYFEPLFIEYVEFQQKLLDQANSNKYNLYVTWTCINI